MSYEEAAQVIGVALGTIKSRVNRARRRLATLVGIGSEAEIRRDPVMRVALAAE